MDGRERHLIEVVFVAGEDVASGVEAVGAALVDFGGDGSGESEWWEATFEWERLPHCRGIVQIQ